LARRQQKKQLRWTYRLSELTVDTANTVDLDQERHGIISLAPDFNKWPMHRIIDVSADSSRATSRDGSI
jgi:hypothetical protein